DEMRSIFEPTAKGHIVNRFIGCFEEMACVLESSHGEPFAGWHSVHLLKFCFKCRQTSCTQLRVFRKAHVAHEELLHHRADRNLSAGIHGSKMFSEFLILRRGEDVQYELLEFYCEKFAGRCA